MALWKPEFPVKFTSDGDYTSQAIRKHIDELSRIYTLLNMLRKFSPSAQPPENPDNYDIWLDASTMELKTYFEGQGWQCVLRVQNSAMSDVSRNSEESGNSGRLGGQPPSYYATEAGLQELREYLETALYSPPMPEFCGQWKPGGGYSPNDIVEYMGSSYVLKEGDGLVSPPDPMYWMLVASAGRDFFMSLLDGGRADTQFVVFINGGAAGQGG